ncbi:MAG TPA: CoA transferase [Burkholderiales bacterium]|nr:CoA transferase [Burkholderiales bacterium]
MSDPAGLPPLAGLRVIEIAGEACAYAGKLFGDAGADVVLVEPPGGHATRAYEPFVDDRPHPDRSLYFWANNTSKRSVVLDLQQPAAREAFRKLVAKADFLIESESPGRMAALGLDYPDLKALNPRLIMISITPYGRNGPRSGDQATDLTLMAGGGIVWNAGYDDHSLPPVRGGGGQGWYAGCNFAVMAGLAALLYRDSLGQGKGQHIDVNLHAACNVTTEAGSYSYLVAGQTVQRQTGRHASVLKTAPVQLRCADGVYIASGPPPRRLEQYAALLEWLATEGLLDQFPGTAALKEAAKMGDVNFGSRDPGEQGRRIVDAARDGLTFIASRLKGYDFFIGAQNRGFQCGIIYTPDEAMRDPHFKARGFPAQVEHPELGRTITYPGMPYRMTGSPARIGRRPPLVGEHTEEVLREVGFAPSDVTAR